MVFLTKSKVYFAPVKNSDDPKSVNTHLQRLLSESKILDIIADKDRVAVKVHFGEEGNTGFVSAEHVRAVCDGIKEKGGVPVVSDTNTLYKGRRTNSKDHLALANDHGFSAPALGAEVVVPDEGSEKDNAVVQIDKKHIKTAKVASAYTKADAIVTVSHFKGHMMTGFGGAIKNVGMGCAIREGKMAQHCDAAPVLVEERCVGCGECVKVCPVNAIEIAGNKAKLDISKCIGCASCIGVCETMAMFVDMAAGKALQEKMAEYAHAILNDKKGRALFINFAVKINKECDCWGHENPRIASDIGIFASTDPVSVDKACFDAVNKACGRDIFKETHPNQDGAVQLKYAEELGLGSLDYELVEV